MDIQGIYNSAIDYDLEYQEVVECVTDSGKSPDQIFNEVSLKIAKEYMSGQLTYVVADEAINNLWCCMVSHAVESGEEFAKLAYSIYIAFDCGEDEINNVRNPIENKTKPMLNEILSNA